MEVLSNDGTETCQHDPEQPLVNRYTSEERNLVEEIGKN